jgi:molybdenum cofactor cytidylyltransferase
MSAAPLADPELVRLPRRSRSGVAHIHLVAATLAAHFYSGLGHVQNSIVVRLLTVIPGIVLAGGKSSRMGRPKALLPIGPKGETFFDRITRTLMEGGVEDVVVVIGADADAIRAAVRPASLHVRLVTNPDFERGQLTSLLAGLRAIDRPGVSAALVTLVDSPLISAVDVRRLIEARREHRAPIVRPAKDGRHGHPVIFGRELFDELRRADPAQGAKSIVHAHAADIIEIHAHDEGAFIDIDTPEDFERWIGPLTS